MKKLTALLLAALMVFTMMACAAKETTTETKQPEQTAEEAKTAETTETSGEEAQEAEGLDYDNPIYIGVLDAFTGDRASNGEYSKEGADLAMEYINANGGVMGRAIELVYEDDQGAEAAATNAFQKITSEYDLAAICLIK